YRAKEKEHIWVARRKHNVDLISSAARRECQPSFLGNNVVKHEFAKLEVQPGAVEQVVQSCVDRLDMKCPEFVRGRNQLERDVLVQRPCAQDVEPAVIKAGERQPLQGGAAPGGVICNLV